MRRGLFFTSAVLLLVAVSAGHARPARHALEADNGDAHAIEENGSWFRDFRERFRAAFRELGETYLPEHVYGKITEVIEAVRESRLRLRRELRELVHNPDRKIGSVISRGSVPENGWQFKLPEDFAGLSLTEFIKTRFGAIPKGFDSEEERAREEETLLLQLSAEDYIKEYSSKLPASFNWFEKYPECMPKSRNQLSCGSCYAWAAAAAASARMCGAMKRRRWTIPKDFMLSPQKLVSCAPTSIVPSGNGCNGGYTGEALKYFVTAAHPEITAFPYVSGSGNAESSKCADADKHKPQWKAFSSSSRIHAINNNIARFIALKRALLNGPVVATMKVPQSFMGYDGKGVFRREDDDDWLKSGEAHSWHAVTIVGWKDATDTEPGYALVLNSWGSTYSQMPTGLKHFFRVDIDDTTKIFSTELYAIDVNLPTTEPSRPAAPVHDGRCSSRWSKGRCHDYCLSDNETIFQPTAKSCPGRQFCCKETRCEVNHSGGACKRLRNGCSNGYFQSGLCPGGNDIKCCIPRISGASALTVGAMPVSGAVGGAIVDDIENAE